MTTLTKYATAYESAGTGWATPENGYADDGSYVTITSQGKKVGTSCTYKTFGFDASLPAAAIIKAVTIEIGYYYSTTSSIAECHTAAIISGAEQTEHTDTSEPTGPPETLKQFVCTSDRSWTRSDLLDANFKVRVEAYQGNTNTAFTMYIDYVRVLVDYSLAISNTVRIAYFIRKKVYAEYKKSHVINASAGAGTGYQIKINVNYGSGTDSGDTVYLGGSGRSDFADVHFQNSSGTELNYWRESYTASTSAVFWVKIEDSLESSSATIYILYGDSSRTTTTGSGTNTFELFDDFDDSTFNTSLWDSTGTLTESGTEIKVEGNPAWFKSKATWGAGYSIRLRAKNENAGGRYCFGWTDETNLRRWVTNQGTNPEIWYTQAGSNVLTRSITCETTYHVFETQYVASNDSDFIYDTTEYHDTTSVSGTTFKAWFYVWEAGGAYDGFCDWILIRKCIASEPSHGSWGLEEGTIARNLRIGYNLNITLMATKAIRAVYNLRNKVTSTSNILYQLAKYGRRWFPMGIRQNIISGRPADKHGFCITHDTNIVAVNKTVDGLSRKYLAYDSNANGDQINLYYSETIEGPWTAYSGNPILGPTSENYRTPSVVYTGGTFHMFLNNKSLKTLRRYTSTDGISFAFQETVIPSAEHNNSTDNTQIWLNPNDGLWYLVWFDNPTSVAGVGGRNLIKVRSASSPAGFAGQTDTIIRRDDDAYPSIFYKENMYWLLCEYRDVSLAKWGVHVYVCNTINGNFVPTLNSPVLSNDEACPVFNCSEDGTLLYIMDNVYESANWYADMRNVKLNSSITGASAVGTNSWTTPSSAYGTTNDSSYATASPAQNSTVSGIWKTYGMTFPDNTTIQSVEVIPTFKLSTNTSITELKVAVSWDGGSTWSTDIGKLKIQEKPTTDTEFVIDFTDATTWDTTKLNDSNFQVRLIAVRGDSATSVTFSVDTIRTRVLYTYPLQVKKALAYNINQSVSAIKKFIYNIASVSKVVATSKLMYNMRGRIESTIKSIYNIRNIVAATHKHIYNIRQSVSASVKYLYTIFNRVTASVKTIYILRSFVVASNRILYNVRGILTKALQIWYSVGISTENPITRNPTAEGTNSWTNPSQGRSSDNYYATAAPAKNGNVSGIWTTFGISDPGGETSITKVEIGIEMFVSTQSSIATLSTDVSYNGGSNWSLHGWNETATEANVADPNAYTWLDITSDNATWTWDLLNDSNLQTRIIAYRGGSTTAVTFSLDAIAIKVTYVRKVHQSFRALYYLYAKVTATNREIYNIRTMVSGTSKTVYNILASVQASTKKILYHIRNYVTATSSQKYNIRNFIVSTNKQMYNILGKITGVAKIQYNILTRITGQNKQIYNILVSVSSTVRPVYRIRGLVVGSFKVVYNVRNLVISTFKSVYSILSSVGISTTVSLKYNLRNSVGSSKRLDYIIRNFVGGTNKQVYHIRGFVSSSMKSIYNVLAKVSAAKFTAQYALRGFVTQTRTAQYKIRNFVVGTSKIVYHILGTPIATLRAVYNIRTTVSSQQKSVYSIRGMITGTSKQIYNIRSVVSASTLKIVYGIRGMVFGTFRSVHNIRGIISNKFVGVYNILVKVSAAKFTSQYIIRGFVSKSNTLQYTIRGFVTSTKRIVYYILGAPIVRLTAVYNIRNVVVTKRTEVYNINKMVSNVFKSIWNIRVFATASLRSVYNLRNSISGSFKAVYSILGRPVAKITAIYNTRNFVSGKFVSSWNLWNVVSSSRKVVYNVLGWISGKVKIQYNVRNMITSSSKVVYNIRTLISGVKTTLVYNIRTFVTQSKKIQYNIFAFVTKSVRAVYYILGAPVAWLRIQYNIRNKVTQKETSVYNINKMISSSFKGMYNILKSVSANVRLQYRLRNFVSAQTRFVYNIIGKLTASLKIIYTIGSRIGTSVQARYSIYNSVSRTRTYIYNVRNSVSTKFAAIWNVRNMVVGSSKYIYNIRNSVAVSTKYVYNIFNFVSKSITVKYTLWAFARTAKRIVYNLFGIDVQTSDPYNRLNDELYDYLTGLTATGQVFAGMTVYRHKPARRPLFFPCVVIESERYSREDLFGGEYKEGTTIIVEVLFKRNYSITRQIILMKEQLARYYRDQLVSALNVFKSNTVKTQDIQITGIIFGPSKPNHTLYGARVVMQFTFEGGEDWEQD